MRVTLPGLALVALLAAAAPAFAKGDVVVATVNGDKITKTEVTEALQSIPQLKGADQAALTAVFPRIVDQIITEKLIDGAAKTAGTENDAEYKKRLDMVKDQLAKQLYVEKFLNTKVTDKAVKAEYEKFKKDNSGKQELRARQILVKTEDEAKKVIADLEKGEKFEELAKKRSSGPSAENGGEIPGYFIKEEMVPEISGAAFSTKPGDYTKTPVKSGFGWHVIKVEEKRARTVPEFKDVEGAIRNKLSQEALAGLATDLRSKAKVELFDMNGKPLEGATQKN